MSNDAVLTSVPRTGVSNGAADCTCRKTTAEDSGSQAFFKFAESNFRAAVFGIPDNAVFIGVQRLTTEFDLEVITAKLVVTLCPTTNKVEIGCHIAAKVDVRINTSAECPVVIDVRNRLKTEDHIVLINAGVTAGAVVIAALISPNVVGSVSFVGVLNFAEHLKLIGIFFEVCDADAEGIQFIAEFCGESVEFGFGDARRILRHSFGNHLRHFITGDVAVAAIGAVAVTFNDARRREFGNRVISPVTRRYVAEGVCCRKRG